MLTSADMDFSSKMVNKFNYQEGNINIVNPKNANVYISCH